MSLIFQNQLVNSFFFTLSHSSSYALYDKTNNYYCDTISPKVRLQKRLQNQNYKFLDPRITARKKYAFAVNSCYLFLIIIIFFAKNVLLLKVSIKNSKLLLLSKIFYAEFCASSLLYLIPVYTFQKLYFYFSVFRQSVCLFIHLFILLPKKIKWTPTPRQSPNPLPT